MATSKDSEKLHQGKRERFMQPSILLGLCIEPSYGYQLIQNLQDFGFVEGQAPPGMIYRHLRQLEEDGLVLSEWMMEETGPAKRMYQLTDEGREMLSIWIEYMEKQAETLNAFVKRYRDICSAKSRERG
ncbi:MAG: PadR family transcriptional regulator [Desulfobacteraceae bacterium]|nr:PadR family transcriptional regulator [Desulfobacteraceae bacterium]